MASKSLDLMLDATISLEEDFTPQEELPNEEDDDALRTFLRNLINNHWQGPHNSLGFVPRLELASLYTSSAHPWIIHFVISPRFGDLGLGTENPPHPPEEIETFSEVYFYTHREECFAVHLDDGSCEFHLAHIIMPPWIKALPIWADLQHLIQDTS